MIIGLDTGERANKTVAVFGSDAPAWEMHNDGPPTAYANPMEAINDIPPGSKVVLENSTCNFDPAMRVAFLATAEERGIELYPIDPRHTKNRRYDYKVSKDDAHDAWVLCQIGKEGIIPKARFQPFRKLSPVPLARLRQLGYDINAIEMEAVLPGVAQAAESIGRLTPPACAVGCGAARLLKKGAKWNTDSYRFFTPLVLAYETVRNGGSLRSLKRSFRLRGIARSNMRHHPLHNRSRSVRKEIMRAQDSLARFMFTALQRVAPNSQTCSASLINRAA